MKKLIKLFPISLIILGSTLEILYYTKRFMNDGIELYLSLIIGISLTLFLSLLMLRRDKLSTWLFIVPLAIYSILCTSAGQSFSLSELHNEQVRDTVQEENRQQQIGEYLSDIEMLNRDLEQLSEQITATTTWARNKYGDVIEAVQERQDQIRAEKKDLQEKISALRESQTVNSENKKVTTNIYQFYNNLFSLNPTYFQFILQTILSFFIAAMAPVSIIILTAKKKPEPKPEPEPEAPRKRIDYRPFIERWVEISWYRKRKSGVNKLFQKKEFLEYWKVRYSRNSEKFQFPETLYDKIFNACIALKIVDKNGDIVNNMKEGQIVDLLANKLNRSNEK